MSDIMTKPDALRIIRASAELVPFQPQTFAQLECESRVLETNDRTMDFNEFYSSVLTQYRLIAKCCGLKKKVLHAILNTYFHDTYANLVLSYSVWHDHDTACALAAQAVDPVHNHNNAIRWVVGFAKPIVSSRHQLARLNTLVCAVSRRYLPSISLRTLIEFFGEYVIERTDRCDCFTRQALYGDGACDCRQ